ncbi:MAG TPA: TonB-dependent receptor plug domain-containing protein [Lacunisphaera sp.]
MKIEMLSARTAVCRAVLFGALFLNTIPGYAQSTAPFAADGGGTSDAKGVTSLDQKPLELSPFQVNAAKDQGYQATSSMSGTRLNSKLEDIAASLSVVTKQQLDDTAAIDINDVFKYEANTEGTYQWTSLSVDRGNVTDNVANDPNGANRVRGLSSANVAVGGFSTTLPFDTYNIDAIEISRGPNSSIFGLGNTGGGVNIITAQANDSKSITAFSTRGDSDGGYRGTFDINRPLIDGKLGLRVLGLYQDQGFEQKPSSDLTRRLELALTAHPFKSTTIRGSFESYRNYNSRPNSVTPRDMTTDWIASGKPTWDPITSTVHLANGTSTTYAAAAADPTHYFGLATVDTAFTTYPSWYIDNGQVQLYEINRTPNATGIGPNNVSGANYLLQDGSYYIRNSTAYPLFTPLGITDKSLYDWTSVNLLAPNHETVKGETSSIQLEQIFLQSPRQTLALQAGWLQERTSTNDRRFLGVGSNTQVFIDINEKLLDGSANPYFLRPYVGGSQPIFSQAHNDSEDYRATLAYELDLSKNSGWTRWFGRNRFSAYSEYVSTYGGSLGYKDTMSSTEAWMNGTPASRNSASYRAYPRYYIGDATGQNVDYAPTAISGPQATYTLRYLNGVSNQWINEPVDFDQYYYANRPNRRLLSTYGGVWQGFLLKERIVPIIGYRHDYSRTRDANSAINPTVATNGYYDTSPLNTFGNNDWVENAGTTRTAGVVVKALSWLDLTYNQSDSFEPGSLAYDVNGQPLPDPHGRTKDYGVQLRFFAGRLVITAKQYETLDIGRSTSDLNTIVQRAVRMDYRSSSGDPGLGTWLEGQLVTLHPDWSETQLEDEVLKLSGVNIPFIAGHINKTHGDASDSVSRGKEIEIIYNPTRFWTIKSTLTQSNPINGSLSPAVQAYIDQRWQTWTTITDPVTGLTWWDHVQANGTIPRDFYTANVLANLKLSTALQGKRRAQTREYRVNLLTNYKLAGITERSWLKPLDIGGSVRWESKAAIGYMGGAPDSDGVVRELDPDKPVWDKDHVYVDFMAGYNLRMFHDKVHCRLQLNVSNIFESGRLQPVAVNPDGQAWAFRIIDPREFTLSAKFDL